MTVWPCASMKRNPLCKFKWIKIDKIFKVPTVWSKTILNLHFCWHSRQKNHKPFVHTVFTYKQNAAHTPPAAGQLTTTHRWRLLVLGGRPGAAASNGQRIAAKVVALPMVLRPRRLTRSTTRGRMAPSGWRFVIVARRRRPTFGAAWRARVAGRRRSVRPTVGCTRALVAVAGGTTTRRATRWGRTATAARPATTVIGSATKPRLNTRDRSWDLFWLKLTNFIFQFLRVFHNITHCIGFHLSYNL